MKIIRNFLFAVFATSVILCTGVTNAFAQQDQRIDVVNRSGEAIFYIYSAKMGRDWDDIDYLAGGQVISNGQTKTIDFSLDGGECVLKVRAKLESGRLVTRYGFNVCRETTWTVH